MGWILSLIILGISLLSMIGYALRRSEAKGNLRELRNETPLRQLSQEEIRLLREHLVQAGKDAESFGHDVYAIEGGYHEHVLESNGTESARHQILGGVDVQFPFDGRNFLSVANRAEVVLTQKHAWVVSLNDAFDLEGGYVRHLAQEKLQRQWREGNLGREPAVAGDTDAADALPGHDRPSSATATAFHENYGVLSQRAESRQEVTARTDVGIAFLGTTSIAAALLFLWIAADAMSARALSIFLALGLCGLGIWLSLRKPKLPEPDTVNRVRGEFVRLEVENQVHHRLLIPATDIVVPVNVPDYWTPLVENEVGRTVDVDLRASDYTAVKFNDVLSVDGEINTSMPVYWGRYLYLALAGLVMFFLFLFTGEGPVQEFQRGRMALLGKNPQVFETVEQLQQALPDLAGSAVTLRGYARCTLRDQVYFSTSAGYDVDCNHLRWGGDAPSYTISDEQQMLMAYYDGSFLSTQRNAARERAYDSERRMLEMLTGNQYSVIPQFDITEPARLIAGIDALCAVQERLSIDCGRLQASLTGMVFDDDADKRWQDVVARFDRNEAPDHIETNEDMIAALRDVARSMVAPAMTGMTDEMRQAILRSQSTGVGIILSRYNTPEWAARFDDRLPELQAYLMLSSDQGIVPFEISGYVDRVDTAKGAGEVFIQDESMLERDDMGALLHLIGWLVASLLTLAGGVMFFVKWWKRQARQEDIVQTYAKKLGISGLA